MRSVYRRSIRLLGYSGFGVTPHETRRRLDLVLAALADGTLRIPIGRVLSLDAVEPPSTPSPTAPSPERSCSPWTRDQTSTG